MFRSLQLSACAFVAAGGLASAASVTVSLPHLKAAGGSQIPVAVSARQAEGLGPLQLDLRFDPAVLDFATASEGKGPTIGLFDFNLVEPGRLRLAMTGEPSQPIRGDQELMLVTFRVVGASGQTTVLNAENVLAWEQTPEGHEMRVDVAPGSVRIGSGRFPFWLIGAILLIATLIAVLALRKRARTGTAKTAAPSGSTSSKKEEGTGDTVFCRFCGGRMDAAAKSCPACGRAI